MTTSFQREHQIHSNQQPKEHKTSKMQPNQQFRVRTNKHIKAPNQVQKSHKRQKGNKKPEKTTNKRIKTSVIQHIVKKNNKTSMKTNKQQK